MFLEMRDASKTVLVWCSHLCSTHSAKGYTHGMCTTPLMNALLVILQVCPADSCCVSSCRRCSACTYRSGASQVTLLGINPWLRAYCGSCLC